MRPFPTLPRKSQTSPPWAQTQAGNFATSSGQIIQRPHPWPRYVALARAASLQIVRLLHAVRMWRERRTTYYELYALSDRNLKDIGLIRNEIESVIYGQSAQRRQRYGSTIVEFGANPTLYPQSRNSS
jgi:uncharacterized protein YjiS (DUF1127 family)